MYDHSARLAQATFNTKDVYIAATLVALGHNYEISRTGKQCFFYFFGDSDFEAIQKQYFGQLLNVDPYKLFSAFKELKARIYNS